MVMALTYEQKNTLARMLRFIPDEPYMKLRYRLRIGRALNLKEPTTFNEKIQWLKLYNRKDEYTVMVDKYAAKNYVAKIIGDQYIIPTIKTWDKFEDVDFNSLPDQFVLKCTHDSGGLVICTDKTNLNIKAAKKRITNSLKTNFFWVCRDWAYKNVHPRIIAEKYMVCKDGRPMPEYKIFCFNGKAKMILVCKGEAHSSKRTNDYCDLNLKRLPFTSLYPNSEGELERPAQMDQMIELAEKLAAGIPQVRIDLYLCDGNIYFGEITLYHNAGFCPIEPYEWDVKLGSWIELPDKKI